MTDWFDIHMPEDALRQVSALGLAHIGDAAFELMVRSYLCCNGRATGRNLHKDTVALVCAPAQARAVELLTPHLTQDELAVYRRGRNAKVSAIPGGATAAQYHAATGFETLLGWLWLSGRRERLNELFNRLMEELYAA